MAATTMSNIEEVLGSLIKNLSEKNYERSFAQYRFLIEIARTCSQIPSDLILNTIWKQISNRQLPSHSGQYYYILYPTSPLVLRFASDAESDNILAPHTAGLRSCLCTNTLRQFYDHWLGVIYRGCAPSADFLLDANLIAHTVNLGYVDETVIRGHILQFLTRTPPPTPPHFQETALFVLFKIAGATFDAYTDSSVVDRCFELLKGYDFSKWDAHWQQLGVGRLYDELVRAKTSCRRR